MVDSEPLVSEDFKETHSWSNIQETKLINCDHNGTLIVKTPRSNHSRSLIVKVSFQ